MKKVLLIVLVLAIFIPAIASAQIAPPNIPRTWWDDLRTFLVQLTDYQPMVFVYPDSLSLVTDSYDTLAVWTFNRATQIQMTELSMREFKINAALTTADSLRIFIMHSTGPDTILWVSADSVGGNGSGTINRFKNTTTLNIAAASACTLVVHNQAGATSALHDACLTIWKKTIIR